jgi:hypothetical protein
MFWEHTFLFLKRKESEFGELNLEVTGIKLKKSKNDYFLNYHIFAKFIFI